MKVPVSLSQAFDQAFEDQIASFAEEEGLLPENSVLSSKRFLARSVVPHVEKLSQLFNRLDEKNRDERGNARQERGLDKYWKQSSNPANLRLAYLLYFMPCNLYRVASVWAELARLGYRWPAHLGSHTSLKAIEFGAGPATGASGIAAGEAHAKAGVPTSGSWALLEQDRAVLKLGVNWSSRYFASQGFSDWSVRPFHKSIDFSAPLLPANAPKFNLWVMSYFLNELTETPAQIADRLLQAWDAHLEEEGMVILVEPALKLQSRKLLEIRNELIARKSPMRVLLPCLGEQSCGALASPEDWCHEEVTWWRPPYLKKIDEMAGLDRKSLPFSYLVLAKTARSVEQVLPELKSSATKSRYRLVSPSHKQGKDQEFFLCGEEGKRRTRTPLKKGEEQLQRGDILLDADVRGNPEASRMERFKKVTSSD